MALSHFNNLLVSKRIFPRTILSHDYSTIAMSDQAVIVDYDYVNMAKDNPRVLVVDVREPNEIEEHGCIPNSLNIPVGRVEDALNKSPEDFQSQFQANKPGKEKELIFYCHAGRRADRAANAAIKLGFTNSKTYMGSWTDWASRK